MLIGDTYSGKTTTIKALLVCWDRKDANTSDNHLLD